jgi:hypothetical protein
MNRLGRTALKTLSHRRDALLANISRNLEKNVSPTSEEIDEVERLDKLEAFFKPDSDQLNRILELTAASVVVLVLIGLCFVRVRSTSLDVELIATNARFSSEGKSTTLIPGETGQILALKKAVISGIETISPETSANTGRLQLNAATFLNKTNNSNAPRNYDPSVRLFAIALPSDSTFSIDAGVAYSGSARGLNLEVNGPSPVNASFGQVIPVHSATTGTVVEATAINEVSVEGKDLQFTLYPADEHQELAVFRDVHVSSISFEDSGHSTILSGTAYVKGSGSGGIALRPSDLLALGSKVPMLLREMTLTKGTLKIVLSVPKAERILLGEDSPRDLRPTLFQWILYRWPNQLYATASALIATWLALRRWWRSEE